MGELVLATMMYNSKHAVNTEHAVTVSSHRAAYQKCSGFFFSLLYWMKIYRTCILMLNVDNCIQETTGFFYYSRGM